MGKNNKIILLQGNLYLLFFTCHWLAADVPSLNHTSSLTILSMCHGCSNAQSYHHTAYNLKIEYNITAINNITGNIFLKCLHLTIKKARWLIYSGQFSIWKNISSQPYNGSRNFFHTELFLVYFNFNFQFSLLTN